MKNEKFAPARKPRADAERNRERLLAVAKPILEAKGSSASFEEIARAASFGIGTLYRHFPTRDALVEAVYRNETELLAAAASRLAATHAPVDALREWMLLFVEYLATKREMSGALGSLAAGTSQLFATSTELITGAILLLTDRAQASGDIHLTVQPIDLLIALAGLAHAGIGTGWKERARQLVDVLIAGLRTVPRTVPRTPAAKRRRHA
ncbi:MAG TPA: TetR/AcrR family transcriptional regulator [Polyangiaceae bacterium]|jgi:AcrR family transcriptional regulator|nr:TetR/AcrR family transcriptional regulator [Polyangiaceae bacterium]